MMTHSCLRQIDCHHSLPPRECLYECPRCLFIGSLALSISFLHLFLKMMTTACAEPSSRKHITAQSHYGTAILAKRPKSMVVNGRAELPFSRRVYVQWSLWFSKWLEYRNNHWRMSPDDYRAQYSGACCTLWCWQQENMEQNQTCNECRLVTNQNPNHSKTIGPSKNTLGCQWLGWKLVVGLSSCYFCYLWCTIARADYYSDQKVLTILCYRHVFLAVLHVYKKYKAIGLDSREDNGSL